MVQSKAKHPIKKPLGQTLEEPREVELNSALVGLIQGLKKSRKTTVILEIQGLQLYAGSRIPVRLVRH